MSSPCVRAALAALMLSAVCTAASAQVEHGGRPVSARRALRSALPTARMRAVDRQALLSEDAARRDHGPLRFADVLEVDLSPGNSGVWEELAGGDRVWRLRLESAGAYSIALVFRRFQLPEGGELFVYDDARRTVRGAYTELENRLDGEFAIQPTPGDALTLEYFEPARARGRSELALALVVHDYRDILGLVHPKGGGGGSGPCEIDVACPEGAPWQDQIAAAAHVLVLPRGITCSGSLLNNTAGDGTALFITAEHCGELANAVFTFNYERPLCGSGAAPSTDTLTGAVELVSDATLDFRLVRLLQPIPPSYGVFLGGWDRSDALPASTATIHHPGGDPKKISLDDDAPAKEGSQWKILQWDRGVTERGSSGAALYSPEGRFLGQLSAGASSCTFPQGDDFYGRLAAQWDLVAPFLDPFDTGLIALDGLDPTTVAPRPLDVTGLLPAQVETLNPGTQKIVRILGAGFSDASVVAIDGQTLPPESYLRAGNSLFLVDPPLLDVGTHAASVTEGAATKSVSFDVVAPSLPRYQAGNGDPGFNVSSFEGVDLFYADQPGHLIYCFWSLSNEPSIHPLLSLGLGNGFTELMYCPVGRIPARGWMKVHVGIASAGPLLRNMTVYSQAVCVRGHGMPLPASNLQESFVLF